MKIVKALGYIQTTMSFEKVTDQVSQTIPDQAYSVKELLEASRKIQASDELYLGDDLELNQLADLPTRELTDQMDALFNQREKVKGLDKKASDEKQTRKKQEQENLNEFKKMKDAEAAKTKNPGGSPDQTSGYGEAPQNKP